MNDLKQKFKKIILIIGDIALLYLSLILALKIRLGTSYGSNILIQHLFPFSILFIFWIIIFYINNLYSLNYARNTYGFYSYIIKSFLVNGVIAIIFFYIAYSQRGISPKTILLIYFIIFSILFICWRILYNYFIKVRAFAINTLILSDDEEAKEIISKINENPQLGYNIINSNEEDFKNLYDFVSEKNIKLIITSEKLRENNNLMQSLYELMNLKIRFENLPNFYEQILGKVPVSIIGKIWFLENIKNLDRPLYDVFKYSMDIFLSFLLIPLFLALLPIVFIASKLTDSGPIFYRQKRIGKDLKIFTIFKFRTMKIGSDKNGSKFTQINDQRITKLGNFLRKMRLDELPQIINILRGEMSFIGPRPEWIELVNEFQNKIPFYNFRHIVKPGLTGWAQINYKYGESTEDAYKKLQYDLYYIKNKSLILDIDTALKTIKIVISNVGR